MHRLKLSSTEHELEALLDQFQAWLATEKQGNQPGFRVSLFLYLQAVLFALTEMALEEAEQALDAILDVIQTNQLHRGADLTQSLEEQVQQLRQQLVAHLPMSLQSKSNSLAGPSAGHRL